MTFSIVVPLYNKAATIRRTLDSVFSQSYPNFEVIIVDDGSTDDWEFAVGEAFGDPRVRIIRQENGGVSLARNTGSLQAKFEFIAYLDGDDLWEPDYLMTVKKAIDENPRVGDGVLRWVCYAQRPTFRQNKQQIKRHNFHC